LRSVRLRDALCARCGREGSKYRALRFRRGCAVFDPDHCEANRESCEPSGSAWFLKSAARLVHIALLAACSFIARILRSCYGCKSTAAFKLPSMWKGTDSCS
jgi:hypothetical protein